jgi:hypothetical protein
MMEGDGAELMKKRSGDGERWEVELNGMAERSGSFGRKPTEFGELLCGAGGGKSILFW